MYDFHQSRNTLHLALRYLSHSSEWNESCARRVIVAGWRRASLVAATTDGRWLPLGDPCAEQMSTLRSSMAGVGGRVLCGVDRDVSPPRDPCGATASSAAAMPYGSG